MLQIIAGNSNKSLVKQIIENLKLSLLDVSIDKFNDGEIKVSFSKYSICAIKQSKTVIIIQSLFPNIHDQLMELLLLADTIKNIKPSVKIISIIPYLVYSRQAVSVHNADNQHTLPLLLITKLCKSVGIAKIVTIDLHNPHTDILYALPIENLTSAKIIQPILDNHSDIILISPDLGRLPYVKYLSQQLSIPYAYINKLRLPNKEITMVLSDNQIKNKHCFIIDDILDSGNTLLTASNLLLDKGALTVTVYVTHLLANNIHNFNKLLSVVKKIYTTDSITIVDETYVGNSERLTGTTGCKILSSKKIINSNGAGYTYNMINKAVIILSMSGIIEKYILGFKKINI